MSSCCSPSALFHRSARISPARLLQISHFIPDYTHLSPGEEYTYLEPVLEMFDIYSIFSIHCPMSSNKTGI